MPRPRNNRLPKAIHDVLDHHLLDVLHDEKWKAFSRFVHNAPGLLAVADLHQLEEEGTLESWEADWMDMKLRAFAGIVLRASQGDELATLQLAAISKMIHPQVHDLQRSQIEYVAKLDRTKSGQDIPRLQRGYAIRRWMAILSDVVAPLRTLSPPRGLAEILGEEPAPRYEKLVPKTKIRVRSKEELTDFQLGLYEGVLDVASKYPHKNMSLQSLAVRVYQAELFQRWGIEKDCKKLGEDVGVANKDALRYSTEQVEGWVIYSVRGGDPMPVRIIFPGWLDRRTTPEFSEN